MNDEEDGYLQFVSRLILDAISDGCDDFADLVDCLPGVYPATVLDTLKQIGASQVSQQARVAALMDSASLTYHGDALGRFDEVLPPHPLDYEWRFSEAAIFRLLHEAMRLTPRYGRVALIATPSIAVSPLRRMSDLSYWYYGRDAKAIVRCSGAADLAGFSVVDLGQKSKPRGTADTVIIDPPWYDEHMLRFIWFCAEACRHGGHALLSLPAEGTRPGMRQQYNRYRAWWEKAGFKEVASIPGVVPYVSPPFERNALRAAGVLHFRSDWRKADLAVLRRIHPNELHWPGELAETHWDEVSFGPVRLRIDTAAPRVSEIPNLVSLVVGDVLATVSRRSSLRHQATVWTSGNRIFACEDTRTLFQLAQCLEGRLSVERTARRVRRQIEPVAQTLAQLSQIVGIERQELGYEQW